MKRYECVTVEIRDLCAVQHHKILCIWIQNTGNSHHVSSYWKHYLARI